MLLKSYLEKLGYTQIHICSNGATGILTFKELVSSERDPIVLLDYMLPDTDARSVLTQMFEIKPNIRVLLATATEEDDEGVKDLIRLGAYQYLQKPIRFEHIKTAFETIEEENSFFKKESSQVKIISDQVEDIQSKIRYRVDMTLASSTNFSLSFLQNLFNDSDEYIATYLKELENKGKITRLADKREISCNQCDSTSITQIFYCPSCKSSKFRSGKLIEHYECGNISEDNTYVDDRCPSCKKMIKAMGVDFRVMKNHYICNDCSNFFPQLSTDYVCLKCQHKFSLDECRWKNSAFYKTNTI
ncbi:MAG: response regulator [Nanoarchaeota archaeon]|nr:response regulator [Nanoarchaeota archaeon]